MPTQTSSDQLKVSPDYIAAKAALLKSIAQKTQNLQAIRGPLTPELAQSYAETVRSLGLAKGREPYFPYLSSGIGSGPFVELQDGSVKLDFINGIGINFFGHSHPELMSELIDGVCTDTMQGNLQPGYESDLIIKELLKHVGKSNLKHAWLFCSGTMANETALKIIRQKKFPATKLFAFKDCFTGRSTAMQEITDNPKYREGQPTYNEVYHLSFYDPELGVDKSLECTLDEIKKQMEQQPGKFAGLAIELVQGEGGIRFAPKEFYQSLFEKAKSLGLAIWVDEVQTFGRTTELFAFQTFEVEKWVDVVTVGKLLHACATLYTADMNPKPGLVAGTFTGSAAALKTGYKILKMLTQNGYYGENGKISHLSHHFSNRLHDLKSGECKGLIQEIRTIGGMIGFGVLSQSQDDTKKVLMRLYDKGLIAFFAGHDPYLIRMLPPFGVLTEKEIDLGINIIKETLLEFK